MVKDDRGPNRRQVLKGVGTGIVPFGGLGVGPGRGPPDDPGRGPPDDPGRGPPDDPGRGREPGEFIVGARTAEAKERARGRAKRVVRVIDFEEPRRRHAVVGRYSAEDLEELERRDDVAYVEPNETYSTFEQTLPWGVDRVDADVAHERGLGSGKSIAIIDTGIDSNHPDLKVTTGVAFGTRCQGDGTICRKRWDDDNGHGTHCAGIARALDNTAGVVGTSTSGPLYAVKVLKENGSGKWGAIADGINWTANNNVKVGSLSLGGSSYSFTLQWACEDAYNRGVLLVAAAGNDSGTVSYPARFGSVVAVSATTQDDGLASFSNRGSRIELAAPGVRVRSTLPGGGYGEKSGTSMACPHVAGAASQVLAHVDTATNNRKARSRLRSTAEDLGADGKDNEFGYGLVDVASALGLASSENVGG